MFKRVAILAALAAGTVFLTACNATLSASDGTTGNEPVDCGEVNVNGSTQKLIAVQANGGIVGCTEAFNVLDEYLTRGTFSGGWACAPDDTAVACVKGDATDEDGLGFHTEPTAETLKPVTCGEVDVDGTKHTLVAQPATDGLVGCTEAFNVIAEYLAIPTQERARGGTDLADDWSCTTDDGETTAIGCVKGHTGDDYGLAFSTTPR